MNKVVSSFYTPDELQEIGFASIGEDVRISKKASIYGASKMSIGNHVRIDDFCILSGKIVLENYIHIAAYCGIWGGNAGVTMHSFSGLSSRSVIYAASDDYSGVALTNPTVPEKYLKIVELPVEIGKHAIIGTGCTILPGATIGEGTSVGSMSLISKQLEPWGIYVGVPACYLKPRSKELLEMERCLLDEEEKRC